MKSLRLILVLILLTGLALNAQAQKLDSLEADLAYHADAMVNMSEHAHREKAGEIFRHKMIGALSAEGGYVHPFNTLKWCQIIMPADSTFRVITWQIELADNKFRYYGIVQKDDGGIIELHDKRPMTSEYASFDQNTWYGSLYYGIEAFKNQLGEIRYLILGFSVSSGNSNKKVADILQFTDRGVKFGEEVFIVPTEDGGVDIKRRILLEYAASSSGRMQFDREKNMLVYDHVILINAGFEGPLWVPDGSFHGFEYKDGSWHFIDKVFNTTVDKPPGEGVDKSELDIIGRKKN